jgi:DNA-directed RNA polymerase subunit E'/Rpb7
MSQNNLYYRTQLENSVSVLPAQLNGSIYENILENLKKKVEGKVGQNGIIIKVIKIINYKEAILDDTNLMANTIFRIKYECFVCSPVPNLEIVFTFTDLVKGVIMGRNGPVIISIFLNNIDNQKFGISGESIIDKTTNKKLNEGEFLKAIIINTMSSLGEYEITAVCKLLGFATDNEIRDYNEDQKLIMDFENYADDDIEKI